MRTGINMEDIHIPDSVQKIGNYAFADSLMSRITIPNSVTEIGKGAFQNCTSLQNIDIPKSITIISPYTFSGCTNLEEVTFGKNITIGYEAFRNCKKLTKVGSDAEYIGAAAFLDCSALTQAPISENTLSIGSYAFKGCVALTEIVLENNLSTIGSEAFGNVTGRLTVNNNRICNNINA